MSASEQFKTFFLNYTDQLKACQCSCGKNDFSLLDSFMLMPRQAFYIFDWRTNTIPYQRGISELLGYQAHEFTTSTLGDYVHPDDADRYLHLVRISNEWARTTRPEPFESGAMLDYRVRHKNGHYLKVIRESTIYEYCRNHAPRSSMNMLTNLTGIKHENSVNLTITNIKTGEVYLENRDAFPSGFMLSEREMEILLRLKKGMNSTAIGEELFISRHTVDTHRRNMLAKTGCRNVMEMVQLASRMGIV